MKKTIRRRLQKATAILLTAVMMLSAFAVLPADLFITASAAEELTLKEQYSVVENQIAGLTLDASLSKTATYYHHLATAENYVVPDGEYVIADTNGTVMTHALQPTGTASGASDAWFFERQSNGKYHIYYNDSNGTKQYLNINSSNSTVATTAQQLVVRVTAAGVTTIGDGKGAYINYSGSTVRADSAATNLTLRSITRAGEGTITTVDVVEVTSAAEIESGKEYIIYNKTSGAGVMHSNLTFSGEVSETSEAWILTADNGGYKIRNNAGTYLNLNFGSGGAPQLVQESSASAFAVNFADGGITFSQQQQTGTDCDGNPTYTTYYVQKHKDNNSVSATGGSDRQYHRLYKIVRNTYTDDLLNPPFVPETATTATPIDDGGYVVYNQGYIVGHSAAETETDVELAVGLNRKQVTVSGSTINTLVTDQFYFEHVEGNLYYVSIVAEGEDGNSVQKYLRFNGVEGYLAFAPDKVPVRVYAKSDGKVCIAEQNSNLRVNHYDTNPRVFNAYAGNVSVEATTDANDVLTLYRNPNAVKDPMTRVDKTELYNKLRESLGYNSDNYTEASFNNLIQVLEDGINTYNEVVTEEEVTKAVYNIINAVNNLEELSDEPDYRAFPATLYKFGYNPSASGNAKYSAGGAAFNAQTYASMEDIIKADENLVEQIKTVIGYNTRAWAYGQADIALDRAIAAYAEIYSLAFTGNSLSSGGTNVTNLQDTAWNLWIKRDTQGANETSDEGASVQGLFGALLDDGNPTDHAPYSTLAYGNVADNSWGSIIGNDYNTEDGFSVTITVGNNKNVSVPLPALDGISVHINDIFTREKVLVDGSTTEYSKYYWDFDFPFVETVENGVTTYKYSSSDDSYLFQASFNDAEQTAKAQLTPGSGSNSFFPFNNQLTGTSPAGSVFHFGMSFSTDFYIPVSGHYLGNDDTDIVFNFSGDDDVLVYIDDVLVLDNGGLHGARTASINFTTQSINYQFAMNVGPQNAVVENRDNRTENITYSLENTDGLTGDELAALEKLREVGTDGGYHTFTFYFLERGSNASNCEIEFNIQQASNHVLLNDETLVVDYGLPVEYDIKANDKVDEIDGLGYNYKGIVEANTEVDSVVIFSEPDDLVSTFASKDDVLDVQGLKYGTATMRGDGLVTYTPNTMNMKDRDYFYTCAEIVGDPTYTTNYYQYERAVFIPATTIYYEDNFGNGLSFFDGTTTNGSNHGKWQTVGDTSLFADAKQAADLVDDPLANPYGYDPIYAGNNAGDNKDYTQYSGFSAKMVTVSAANNTNQGGTNPTVEFEFTGTGFDVISVTDNTTGVFYVEIFDSNGNQVGKRRVVDTYYGYNYGQLYFDENSKATLTPTDKPAYKNNEGAFSTIPYYYDEYGNITKTVTDSPAYAFGWLTTSDALGLYQIPVIKINGLDYGTYTVKITPMYTSLFDHNGTGQFNLYVDAIRIYDPAGKDDGVESSILTDYKYDNESYPNSLELKDMLIGADMLSKGSAQQGVIFIDGIAALDNDLETYKLAGPNNELYLAKGQAVAFEIWASAIPDEVQLGVKSVKGKPTLGITYGGETVKQDINTATEMNYVINNLLSEDGKLEWSKKVIGKETYYRTDTIVIKNASDDSSILSLTSMKWTFTGVDQYGHYEVSAGEEVAQFSLMSNDTTVARAYSMIRPNSVIADDEDINEVLPDDSVITDDEDVNETIPDDSVNDDDNNDDEPTVIVNLIQKLTDVVSKVVNKVFDFVKSIFSWRA